MTTMKYSIPCRNATDDRHSRWDHWVFQTEPNVMASFPRVILLPGLHGTDELWGPLLAAMPAEVPRTMVRYPTDRVLSRGELVALIEAAIPRLGPLVVMAESFSGPLAVEFAARNAGRVQSLVLCATFVRPPWPAWLCRCAAAMARYFMRPLMYLRGLLPDRIADATVGRAAQDALRVVLPEVVASRLEIIAAADCCQLLQTIRAPVLYLQASRDIVIRRRCLRQIQELRPDVQLRVIESSHMVLQRRPREAWAAVAALVDSGGSSVPRHADADLFRPNGAQAHSPGQAYP